ncbi:MAG: hypothetical protein OMM_04082 [Candidatus Magnetoglobus multicellularis str. Araruama]|uniref:histidine kinase n=1 Tax=Candidatus Magnetoglobus multicellularis str. Araruama TaxID=890399 RepID=A0A1V1P324_9BACT|nr:MAG: hypothetical protein OMM_04082 [Candidatus Magnetoglobus multicellularis str. Araruama]
MTKKQVSHLFQAFHQTDTSITRKYGGTGLGLVISKRLIEMMNGKIKVNSQPDVGTEFYFTASFGWSNMKISSKNLDISKSKVKELISDKHVLLVEDNEINLQVAQELLEGVGVRITAACNGKQAVAIVKQESFDAILMDIQMPEMDGYTATHHIRTQFSLKDLPIIAMTANAMAGEREKCLSAGMNDHISKPVKPLNLFETLIRWLRPDIDTDQIHDSLSQSNESPQECDNVLNATIDGVDVQLGFDYMNKSKDLYLKTLNNFYNRFTDINAQIQAKLSSGKMQEAERLVHTFKSLAGSIGAKKLESISSALESAIQLRIDDNISSGLKDLAQEHKKVIPSLKMFLVQIENVQTSENDKQTDNNQHNKMNHTDLTKTFEELAFHIKEGNSDAVDLITPLESIPELSDIANDIRDLKNQVDDYEFEDASETLKRICDALNIDNI